MHAEFFALIRDISLLAVGALLGFLASLAMWRWQLREERKQKRAEHILRAVHLALSALTHARCLLSAKTQGVKGYLDLPENPVDELMAMAALHLHKAMPLVQRLHDKQQELFAHSTEGPHAAESMLRLAGDFPGIVNQLIKQLGQTSEDGRVQEKQTAI